VCRPYRLRPLLLTTIPGQGEVWGLCKLNNKLYIAHYEPTTLSVYTSTPPYTHQHNIHTQQLAIITNIASCSINNCVYVAAGSRGVYRVTTDKQLVPWLQNVGVAGRVSVTSDGRIVVRIATDVQGSAPNYTWRGRVEVYNPAGVRLTILKLPHDIVNPLHVVQTANKSFIISHGNHRTELNRVCEVNNEGVIVASYGGPRGSGLGQLHTPDHVTLDNKERVIVADCLNYRVLLLDRQLNIQRVLLSWKSTGSTDNWPCQLVYDSDKSQLMVGLNSGRTEIYKV